jgi:hypothetical protein
MQAATAPHVWFPILCFGAGGLGSFAFVVLGLRPTLRSAVGEAAYTPWALAVATLLLGNSFPLIPCQVGPACSAQQQLNSLGGMTDAIVASLAFLVVAFSPGPLWRRLRELPGWGGFGSVAAAASAVLATLFLALCASSILGVDEGLTERILAVGCTLWLACLAAMWMRVSSQRGASNPWAPGARRAHGPPL